MPELSQHARPYGLAVGRKYATFEPWRRTDHRHGSVIEVAVIAVADYLRVVDAIGDFIAGVGGIDSVARLLDSCAAPPHGQALENF